MANASGKAKGTGPKLNRWSGLSAPQHPGFPSHSQWERREGHSHITDLQLQAFLRAAQCWSPDCSPDTVKGRCEGSQACRMVCMAGLSRKDARAICSAGIRTRDTYGEAKHTDHLNRKLYRYFKLNWTLGTCSKMFVRLLLPVPTYFAASEERGVCSCSHLGGLSWHRCWAGVFTPLHKHKAGIGTVTISGTQAPIYTPLAARFFTQYF